MKYQDAFQHGLDAYYEGRNLDAMRKFFSTLGQEYLDDFNAGYACAVKQDE